MLRDADGNLVRALVEPAGRGTYRARDTWHPAHGQPMDAPCAAVEYLDQTYVHLKYELTTGDPSACYPQYPDWESFAKAEGSWIAFGSSDCSGTPFSWAGGSAWHYASVGGTVYYTQAPAQATTTLEYRSSTSGEGCETTAGSLEQAAPYVAVPLADALSNPPYSLELAY